MGGRPDRKTRILVVDDEASVRELCVACIRHGLGAEFDIVEAANGEEALAAVAADPPDLILLDIMMPAMDGYEVCRRLKQGPETRAIPIVFLTALGKDENIEKGLALGGDSYVVKPFNAVTLAAQISELLTPRSEGAD